MNKKCLGCGSILQSDDKDKLGYIREDKILTASYCERCFKLTNYGEYKIVNTNGEEYIDIYKEINKTNDLVLFLADIFTLNSSLDMINKYINNKIILVITKYDIIPKSVKENKIKEKIKEYNFNKNIIDIIIVSSKTNYNIDHLYNEINNKKTSKNVYLVGNTNAGKSTLINKLITNYTDNSGVVTTSILPSTTINVNEIKLNDDLILIDTPGFIEKDNISNYIDPKKLKRVMPSSEIRPITYQLEEGKTLLIDDLARIEYVKGEKNSFTFYISNDIIVSRINTITNNRGKNLKCHNIDVKAGYDVIVNGLCFIKITKDAKLKVYTLDNVLVYKRKSLI
jgi:hypothetical protein